MISLGNSNYSNLHKNGGGEDKIGITVTLVMQMYIFIDWWSLLYKFTLQGIFVVENVDKSNDA